jgi:hypothetical protein
MRVGRRSGFTTPKSLGKLALHNYTDSGNLILDPSLRFPLFGAIPGRRCIAAVAGHFGEAQTLWQACMAITSDARLAWPETQNAKPFSNAAHPSKQWHFRPVPA